MADDQRPAEAANRADREQRAAHDIDQMTQSPSPHGKAVLAATVATPKGGYAKEGS